MNNKNFDMAYICEITKRVLLELENAIPVGVSSRHVHLSEEHLQQLFGAGYKLKVKKPLSQPDQFAAEETVDLVTETGIIERVRVLGPARGSTQVELAKTDAVKLGLNPPVRNSGDVKGTPGLIIQKHGKSVALEEGVIIARRHIHMSPSDAGRFGVSDGERVEVEVCNGRGGVFRDVLIRVSNAYQLDFHIDTDEGNAFALRTGDTVRLGRVW